MNRRTFLRNTTALGAAGLAGCMADADENASDSPGNDPDDSGEVTVVDSFVEVTDTGCSSGAHSTATVSTDEDTETVSFSGHLVTPTPCYEVTVSRTTYNHDDDMLTVDLGTAERATDDSETDEIQGGCIECEGRVDFEGRVDMDGGVPSRVVVTHDDSVIADTDDDGRDDSAATEPEAVELVEESFTLTSAGSGSQTGDADVAFSPDEDTVVVTGTITGNDGCTTAELGSASYDPDTDELSVDVVTRRREGTETRSCTQALVALGYEATFTFEGGIPHRTSVSHDGEPVLAAGYESASESADEPDGA